MQDHGASSGGSTDQPPPPHNSLKGQFREIFCSLYSPGKTHCWFLNSAEPSFYENGALHTSAAKRTKNIIPVLMYFSGFPNVWFNIGGVSAKRRNNIKIFLRQTAIINILRFW